MKPARNHSRTTLIASVGILAAIALVGCSGHNVPTDVGGEPSDASEVAARQAAVEGLKDHDEGRFVSAVTPDQRSEAVKAWKVCEPLLKPGAKVTYNDAVVTTIVGVFVHPADKKAKGCWVTLSWKEGRGWSMTAELSAKTG
ncbi:hypothetical protein [Curtobacterium flaccumfaciens]|uniref:hypothetical protein n=1 Tax=Curtobacterium flaccumfaciens TaxID=2035 RepID=UPI001BDEF549|nr:hypothetical protein [Curtobacterium flaccumfaciens]MBT1671817.1 hypothetical protein [Curtobacterium flaccumfaciens pv. flaccumfaciens]